MAERVGFEPTVPLRAQRFSRPPRSTTPAPLRRGASKWLWSRLPVDRGGALAEGSALAKRLLACRRYFPTLSLVIEKSVSIPAAIGAPHQGIITPPVSHARFAIGDVVRHRLFEFRGVVFDVDPVFANSEEWYEAIPEDIRPSKDQPFYHLFAENSDSNYIAYVSQQKPDAGRQRRADRPSGDRRSVRQLCRRPLSAAPRASPLEARIAGRLCLYLVIPRTRESMGRHRERLKVPPSMDSRFRGNDGFTKHGASMKVDFQPAPL